MDGGAGRVCRETVRGKWDLQEGSESRWHLQGRGIEELGEQAASTGKVGGRGSGIYGRDWGNGRQAGFVEGMGGRVGGRLHPWGGNENASRFCGGDQEDQGSRQSLWGDRGAGGIHRGCWDRGRFGGIRKA